MVDTEFHDDDEFTKTLEQLDKQEAKKVWQREEKEIMGLERDGCW